MIFLIIIYSLFNSNFSNSFETTGSSGIGLCEVTSFGGFLGLGIIITSAIFHTGGVYFNLKRINQVSQFDNAFPWKLL
jgi:hypothetical protein